MLKIPTTPLPPRTGRTLKIALIGTRGVPARYGGFETCVEEVGRRLVSRGHQVTVYCRTSKDDADRPQTHLGMKLVYLPCLRRRSLETLTHSGLSAVHLALHRTDAAVLFNAANSPWLPLIRRSGIPVATHVDGLEWKRSKWGAAGQRYYRLAEAAAVRWSDALIADAVGIQDYYREKFDADTDYIAYGAPLLDNPATDKLDALDLTPGSYHLAVARFEPENHLHLIVDGYRRSNARRPLVVVGTAPYANQYIGHVHSLADERVQFLGGVWDQELLDQLYANAHIYWHGHSVGGTNPSLLRAIGAGTATNAFDVNFNREILGSAGRYFNGSSDVEQLINNDERNPADAIARGVIARRKAERYNWDDVALRYEALCRRLATGRDHRRRAAHTSAAVGGVRA